MKKIINGKKYDTKTANYLFETYRGMGRSSKLFRKTTGEFFIANFTSWEGEKDSIDPISDDKAKDLIGEEDADMYEEFFGKVEE